jgi:hypothetical protein
VTRRPAALILALAAALCLLALAVVMARRERPVTATLPAEDDTLPPFDPGTWPLVSDNLTSAGPGWYDWRLTRQEWEALN